MITFTGFDRTSFFWLHTHFECMYTQYSPHSVDGNMKRIDNTKGRRRLLTSMDCLALCLSWTRFRGSVSSLQMIFGITGTPLSLYLRFGRRILVAMLQKEPDTAIRLPSNDEIEDYKKVIAERHPSLDGVWCTMDGLKLNLQQAGNRSTQNMYYNGWTHSHYVSAVLVFCPDGTIPIATYNVPGCFHDSTIAEWGNIYQKLSCIHDETGGKCTVDSAFSKQNYPFLIKSSQTDPESNDPADFIVNNEATSMRQSAEWGMRALQSSFPRLKDQFKYEETGERKIVMKMIILLYNLRARRVGINQIRNTYMAHLQRDPLNLLR